jgi:hypothetical protein
MSESGYTRLFYQEDRCLIVHVSNLEHGPVTPILPEETEDVFDELAPHFTERRQELLIHDLPEHTLEEKHIDGAIEGLQAVRIGVPSWPVDAEQLKFNIAYFLHLMARWQHFDLPYTLGEELAAVGMALHFAERHSTWTPPWVGHLLPPGIYRRAAKAWTDKEYDYADWFSTHDEDNLGYPLAYELARRYLGGSFNLRESIKATGSDLQPLLGQ